MEVMRRILRRRRIKPLGPARDRDRGNLTEFSS
jgi:hypothetical protein